jgi:hypothetical protein
MLRSSNTEDNLELGESTPSVWITVMLGTIFTLSSQNDFMFSIDSAMTLADTFESKKQSANMLIDVIHQQSFYPKKHQTRADSLLTFVWLVSFDVLLLASTRVLPFFCNQHILCDKTNKKDKRMKEAQDDRLLKMMNSNRTTVWYDNNKLWDTPKTLPSSSFHLLISIRIRYSVECKPNLPQERKIRGQCAFAPSLRKSKVCRYAPNKVPTKDYVCACAETRKVKSVDGNNNVICCGFSDEDKTATLEKVCFVLLKSFVAVKVVDSFEWSVRG